MITTIKVRWGLEQLPNALFEMATQGNVTAMIYFLKVRYREN
jgi:hypothetical protein